jgi:hypothetical protein
VSDRTPRRGRGWHRDQESARFFGVANSDPHHPDVFGIAQVGTIYAIGSKIAEHCRISDASRRAMRFKTRRRRVAGASRLSALSAADAHRLGALRSFSGDVWSALRSGVTECGRVR